MVKLISAVSLVIIMSLGTLQATSFFHGTDFQVEMNEKEKKKEKKKKDKCCKKTKKDCEKKSCDKDEKTEEKSE